MPKDMLTPNLSYAGNSSNTNSSSNNISINMGGITINAPNSQPETIAYVTKQSIEEGLSNLLNKYAIANGITLS